MRKRARFIAVVATAGIGMCGVSACGLVSGKTFRDDAEVSKKITAVRLDNTSGASRSTAARAAARCRSTAR